MATQGNVCACLMDLRWDLMKQCPELVPKLMKAIRVTFQGPSLYTKEEEKFVNLRLAKELIKIRHF